MVLASKMYTIDSEVLFTLLWFFFAPSRPILDSTYAVYHETFLLSWAERSRHVLFGIPIIWSEPKYHVIDIIFSLTHTKSLQTNPIRV